MKQSNLSQIKLWKINKYIIGLYFLFLLIFILLDLSIEGSGSILGSIYIVFILYYAFTGFLFGLFEFFVFLRVYLKRKKKIVFLWMIIAIFYAAGSIFLAFFSNFVL